MSLIYLTRHRPINFHRLPHLRRLRYRTGLALQSLGVLRATSCRLPHRNYHRWRARTLLCRSHRRMSRCLSFHLHRNRHCLRPKRPWWPSRATVLSIIIRLSLIFVFWWQILAQVLGLLLLP